VLKNAEDLEKLRNELLKDKKKEQTQIAVCSGTGCRANASEKVVAAFRQGLQDLGMEDEVELKNTGCHGFCEQGPIAVILPQDICYLRVKEENVEEILEKTVRDGEVIEELLFEDEGTKEKIIEESKIPFYKNQERILLAENRKLDPKNIDDYIAHGGYRALSKVLQEMTPEEVMDQVDKANLRGRGGGGFPAGKKFRTTAQAPGEPKYVIVNADEGDPGAYMDRSILEGNPHRVLEGLIIGAYAIGSSQGFVYVRQEYPLALENLTIALEQAREKGFLGGNILDSGFNFDVAIHRGAGAFVSGESSALMTAIEGWVGEPRPKYIRTAVSGIHGKPSNLNNVETWANIPLIMDKGVDWFLNIGTENNPGTKILSLVGNVRNTGLVEIAMGTSLRQLIYDIGGGIPGDKKFKAVQTGGPSGGCIPTQYLDEPIDFDNLSRIGSMMGSGGMIVMDEETCMVDVARYFLNFLKEESCGKCTPCREGIKQMLDILDKISQGKGEEGHVELLQELGDFVEEASLCALGTTAPYPVLSTIKYFQDEYEAHIKENECPAGVCKELIAFVIDEKLCTGCALCRKNCPSDAIAGEPKETHTVIQGKCIKCGICLEVCPPRFAAVKKEKAGKKVLVEEGGN